MATMASLQLASIGIPIVFGVAGTFIVLKIRKSQAAKREAAKNGSSKKSDGKSNIELIQEKRRTEYKEQSVMTQVSLYSSLRAAQTKSGFSFEDKISLFVLYQILFLKSDVVFEDFKTLTFPDASERPSADPAALNAPASLDEDDDVEAHIDALNVEVPEKIKPMNFTD